MFDDRIYKYIEEHPDLAWLKDLLEKDFVLLPPKYDKYLNDTELLNDPGRSKKT